MANERYGGDASRFASTGAEGCQQILSQVEPVQSRSGGSCGV